MSELVLIQLVTAFDVLLCGVVLAVIPSVTRRGLLFGVHVGEPASRGADARALVRQWHVGVVACSGAALLLGLGLGAAGQPIAGNLGSLGLLLVVATGLYLRQHFAPLTPDEPGGLALPAACILLCLVAGAAVFAHAAAHYAELPERVPVHFGTSGEPDAWSDKSLGSVMVLPLMTLMMGPFIAGFGLLTARAKRSVRRESDGRSLQAQTAFRAAVTNMLCGTALLTTAMTGYLSVQAMRVGLGQARSLGSGTWWLGGALLVFVLGYTVRLVWHHGQGGAFQEDGADAPLTNGLADDEHWVLGAFYVNRDDPSIMVEKRFGIGYTINFGNWKAVAILVAFLVITLGLTGVALLSA